MKREIQKLRNDEHVKAYWEDLLKQDQFHWGEKRDSINRINLKKTILLIKYYGYPHGDFCSEFIQATPMVIFSHQLDQELKRVYFPIFFQEWGKGRMDITWICQMLEGMYRTKFQKGLIEGNEVSSDQIDLYINELQVDVSNIRFDFEPIEKFEK